MAGDVNTMRTTPVYNTLESIAFGEADKDYEKFSTSWTALLAFVRRFTVLRRVPPVRYAI